MTTLAKKKVKEPGAIERCLKEYYNHRDAYLNFDEGLDKKALAELAALRAALTEARPIIWGMSSLARTGHYDPAADKWLAKYGEK